MPRSGGSVPRNMGPFFAEKRGACGNVPRSSGLVKIWSYFSGKKKRLQQRTQKLRACKNMGAIFLRKKAPAATCPETQGVQKYGGHFSEKKQNACGNVPRSSGLPKRWGPFFKNILSRNRLNRLLIYPIMVTKKSIWSKSHSGYCFQLPVA